MRLQDLKIGDRVKVYNNKEGIITSIGFANDFYIKHDDGVYFLDGKDIISKLEPQYKEIPIDKEKSTPKSYKFDIEYVNSIEWHQDPITPFSVPNAYFKINGMKITNHNYDSIFEVNGKKLTIEIKEKE